MKKKTIVTALLFCITLYIPLSVFSQDFQMNGTQLVKYLGNAANVTIPSSVTSIGDYAFSFCVSLASVTIPSSVTSIGEGAFGGCKSLTSVTVDNQNSAYSSADGVLFNKNRTVLIQYPPSKQRTSYTIPAGVTIIGNGAFSSCNSLTSVTIPAGVTIIGNGAFSSCNSLTNVTIPAGVTSIGDEAFRWCESLTSVRLSRKTTMGINAFPDTVRIIYSD